MARPGHGQPTPLCPEACSLTPSLLCLLRYELLQPGPQGNLHPIAAVGPVVHEDEVGVVAVQAGQVPLTFLVHDVLGREAALGMGARGESAQGGKLCTVNAGAGASQLGSDPWKHQVPIPGACECDLILEKGPLHM